MTVSATTMRPHEKGQIMHTQHSTGGAALTITFGAAKIKTHGVAGFWGDPHVDETTWPRE